MSNICSRCGHLIEYSLATLRSINTNHCHFCVSEFNAIVENLDKDREERMAKLESELKEKSAELRRMSA